jgi:hypothetical protein
MWLCRRAWIDARKTLQSKDGDTVSYRERTQNSLRHFATDFQVILLPPAGIVVPVGVNPSRIPKSARESRCGSAERPSAV